MFTLTEAAEKKIKSALQDQNLVGVLVDLKKSGCNGYKYVLKYVDKVDNDWKTHIVNNISVSVSNDHYTLLTNTLIDYKTELFKEGFEFSNPNEAGQCGCGESVNFDIETLRL